MLEEVEFTKDPDHSQMPWKADHDHPVWMEGGHIEGQEPGSFYSAGEQRHIWIEADGKAGPVALVLCDEGDEEAQEDVALHPLLYGPNSVTGLEFEVLVKKNPL